MSNEEKRIASLQEELARTRDRFNIEMDCKNRAYYFILSRNLLYEFQNYINGAMPEDQHRACIDILADMAG